MNFASDNGAGVAPEILDAIVRPVASTRRPTAPTNTSARAAARLSEVFERPVAAFLVATGTAANALALGALVRPWEAVFCHEEAHIQEDECGAPELFTAGAKLVGIPGVGGKITPDGVARDARPLPARAGQDRRSRARCRCPRRAKRARSTGPTKSRRWPRSPASGARRAHGRRALRQCAGLGPRFAGRHDLARRRRRAVARRHQEWRARLRGGDLLRSRTSRELSPTSASAPGRRCRRAGSWARKWRPIWRTGFGSTWRERANAAARASRGWACRRAGRAAGLADGGQRSLRRRAGPNSPRHGAPPARNFTIGARARSRPMRRRARGETMMRLVTSFETREREVDALIAMAGAPHGRRNSQPRVRRAEAWVREFGSMNDTQRAVRAPKRLVLLTAAVALLALSPAAKAQGLFSFPGDGPPSYEIERRLEAGGYELTRPLSLAATSISPTSPSRGRRRTPGDRHGDGAHRRAVSPAAGARARSDRTRLGSRGRRSLVRPAAPAGRDRSLGARRGARSSRGPPRSSRCPPSAARLDPPIGPRRRRGAADRHHQAAAARARRRTI